MLSNKKMGKSVADNACEERAVRNVNPRSRYINMPRGSAYDNRTRARGTNGSRRQGESDYREMRAGCSREFR